MVCPAARGPPHRLRPFARVGRRPPAHSTALGKALLATRDDEQVRGLLPATLSAMTEHRVTGREELTEELRVIRGRGFPVDREESTPGPRCFGVAVPYRIPARDAVSCSVPAARLTPARERSVRDALLDARDRPAPMTRRP